MGEDSIARDPFPVWASAERGGHVECVYRGAIAVVDDRRNLRAHFGDATQRTFVRSSLKMMQAIPLVTSGALDDLGILAPELAVCCASHSGEPYHVHAVESILRRAGLDVTDLRCGVHWPLHRDSAHALVRDGLSASAVHNNCSGKHAGMLAQCTHAGWSVQDYLDRDHPVQVSIAEALACLLGTEARALEHGTDGCGVPAYYLSLQEFAAALARFVSSESPVPEAAHEIFTAMYGHPEFVAGTDRICTALMRSANRPILAKGGAEGFYAVAWREEGRGVALALKAAAGDERSRDFAVVEACQQLGLLDEDGVERLAPFHRGPLRNHAGTPVGWMRSQLQLAALRS